MGGGVGWKASEAIQVDMISKVLLTKDFAIADCFRFGYF